MQSLFLGAIFGHIIQAKIRRRLPKLGTCPKQREQILLWFPPPLLRMGASRSEAGRGVDIVCKSASSWSSSRGVGRLLGDNHSSEMAICYSFLSLFAEAIPPKTGFPSEVFPLDLHLPPVSNVISSGLCPHPLVTTLEGPWSPWRAFYTWDCCIWCFCTYPVPPGAAPAFQRINLQ